MNKENNKKSRRKRGMTLVEVIISIAVMAVLALLLVTVGVTIDNYRKDTKARNDRIAIEGPAAETRDTKESGRGKLIDEEFKITVSRSGGSVEVTGKLYSTSPIDELTDTGIVDSDGVHVYSGNTKGHFKFIDIGS
ncbi:MAG: type II secretion system GspH family protein [Ruminococcus sp.]|nr:type II secretion system GspH family protein [Ruminococcus sp.]